MNESNDREKPPVKSNEERAKPESSKSVKAKLKQRLLKKKVKK